MIAFKNFEIQEEATTKVVKIEWHASKDKYVKPTVIVEPVNVSGITIGRANGFNAKYILDHQLGPGSIITVVRSSDVIPYIKSVVSGTKASMPSFNYVWTDTQVDIIYVDGD